MNVLLLSAYFPPEVGSAPHLFHELGRELAHRGHRVTVLTGFPTYNVDEKSLPEHYRKGTKLTEFMDGMQVIRVRSPRMPRHIPVLRGLEQVAMALTFTLAGLFLAPSDDDIVLLYSPPLFLGLTAFVLRVFRGNKVAVNVQDLFPQSAIDLGVLKSRFLISLFRSIERRIYRRGDLITVHSPGNRDHVLRSGGNPESVAVVPNLVDIETILLGERNNSFRQRFDIPTSQFVVSFAGVIGLSQDVDTIIDAAAETSMNCNLVYYIVGDGIEKERLMVRAKGMPNVRFLPMLPRDEYVELLHASDVCLVTLHKEVKTPVVPSKILSIMAAGRPILASMPEEGDGPRLIEDARCGVCVPADRPKEFAAAITKMYAMQSELADMGKRGRNYAERHFSLEACAEMYERLFTGVISKKT